MKKFLSVVLAVLMCVLPLAGNMTVSAAGAQATYTLSDDEGYAGENVEVKVSLTVDGTFNTIGFAGLEYEEDALEFVKGSIDSELSAMCGLKKFDKNQMTLVAAFKTEDDDGEPIAPPTEFDGVVCTLTFKIKENAPVGKFDVTIGDPQVKLNSTLLDAEVEAATVTVLGKDFDPELKFVGAEVEYDGDEHMIEVQNLPDFAEVEYTVDGDVFEGTKNVGDYEITAVVTADGYNTYEETATLTITEKDVNVTINVPAKEYDGTTEVIEDPELEIDGLVDGDDVEISVEAEYKSANAGSVDIDWDAVVEGADADNYNFKFNAPKATITKKDVTVIISDVNLMIGDTLPAVSELEYTTEPELVEGDSLVGSLSYAKGANTNKEAQFAINGTFAAKSNPNYNIEVEPGTLYVKDKTEQDIVVNADVPEDLTYGDDGFAIEIEYGAVVSDNDTVIESSNDNVVRIDGNNVVVVGAGKATITITKEGTEEIADFEDEIFVTVAQKEIVVTAIDASKRIGSEDPELEYDYDENELVGNDAFTGALEREKGETAKDYDINQGTLTLGANYKIIFNEGTFTIYDKTPQEVDYVSSFNKTYGDDSFNLNVTVGAEATASAVEYSVVSGNVEVDTDGNVTILGAGTAKIAVTKAGDADYADFSKTVTVNVAQKEITITAKPAEKYVGQETPALEYDYDEGALVGDDTVTGELAVNDGNKAGQTYNITLGSVKINNNYKIKYVGAKLTVLAKLDQELSFSAPEEAMFTQSGLTWSIEPDGDYNEDAAFEVVSSNPEVATVSEDGSIAVTGVGKTVLTAKNAGNYKYNEWKEFVTLEVAECPLVITVNDASKRIDNDDPVLTYSYSNLYDEEFDIESGVEVDGMVVTLTRKAGEALGEYSIDAVVEIENKDFYDIKINKGTFTIIEKYPTSIIIDKKAEAVYGDADITFTPSLDKADEIGGEIAYKFASDNEDVVSFADEGAGTAAVNGVGKAVVTITFDGTDDYAGSASKVEVTVSAKAVTVENVDLVAKTADVVGLVDGDAAEVDFNKVVINVEETEFVVTNFVLVGEDAVNYVVATEEVRIAIEDAGEVELATVSDGGSENGSVEGLGTYLAGSTVTLTAVAKSGYKFDRWLVNGEEVDGKATIELEVTEDTEVVAEFKKGKVASVVGGGGSTPERTIKFVVDGKEYTAVTVDKGDKVKAPEAPVKEGYVFGGWFTDEACTNEYSFSAKVNSSMTLYAKWTEEVVEEEPKEEEPTEEEPKEDSAEWTNTYADVKENDWFYEAVKTVSEKGIMNGMKEGEFAPNVALTRAMLVTMLYRIEGSPETDGSVAYTDVNLGEYYGNALVWATENKIVNGVSETEFAPNANITREQIATIIFRYAALKGVEAVELSENLHFDDAEMISDYAVAPMNWLVGKEIIKGYENNTIQPQGNATRAEVATIVTRILAFLG